MTEFEIEKAVVFFRECLKRSRHGTGDAAFCVSDEALAEIAKMGGAEVRVNLDKKKVHDVVKIAIGGCVFLILGESRQPSQADLYRLFGSDAK